MSATSSAQPANGMVKTKVTDLPPSGLNPVWSGSLSKGGLLSGKPSNEELSFLKDAVGPPSLSVCVIYGFKYLPGRKVTGCLIGWREHQRQQCVLLSFKGSSGISIFKKKKRRR